MDFEVGYKKPPRGTRFRKGQSGNLKGRPKKTVTSLSQYCETLERKKIPVTDRGKRIFKAGYEVGLEQIARKISRGDLDAWSEYRAVLKAYGKTPTKRKFIVVGGLQGPYPDAEVAADE
jgi:hypothetical protein